MSPQVKQLAVVALAVAVLGGVAFLALGANEESEVTPDDARLARAKAEFNRGRAESTPPPPAIRKAPRTEAEPPATPSEPQPKPALKLRQGPGIPQPGQRGIAGAVVADRVNMSPGTTEFVAAMDEVNKTYDRGDYQGAVEAAEEVLKIQPNNVRMLRVAVSSHCILGNHEQAHDLWDRLPSRDQRQVSRRCLRYGVEFER